MESEALLSPPSLPPAIHHPSSIPTPSTRGICVRILTIASLISVSLWANYEASKGFDLTIYNAPSNTLDDHRFNLMFASNGKAAKLLLEASDAIEHILYPGHLYAKKPVLHVIVALAGQKTHETVQVKRSINKKKPGEYLILLNPEILEEKNPVLAMKADLYRAMTYVWLWDGTTATQRIIVDAMAEFLMVQSGFNVTLSKNMSSSIRNFIQKCDNSCNGFVARLNNDVHKLLSYSMVDQSLDQFLEEICLEHLQRASF